MQNWKPVLQLSSPFVVSACVLPPCLPQSDMSLPRQGFYQHMLADYQLTDTIREGALPLMLHKHKCLSWNCHWMSAAVLCFTKWGQESKRTSVIPFLLSPQLFILVVQGLATAGNNCSFCGNDLANKLWNHSCPETGDPAGLYWEALGNMKIDFIKLRLLSSHELAEDILDWNV